MNTIKNKHDFPFDFFILALVFSNIINAFNIIMDYSIMDQSNN